MMPALPALLALSAIYLPVYWSQALGPWQSPEQSHAPIVALIAAGLAWRARSAPLGAAWPAPLLGMLVLAPGLSMFTVGSLLASSSLTLASQLPVFAGVALVLGGIPVLRALGFPLTFLAFMLPLPAPLIDAGTAPLKAVISHGAEELLHLAGYPIARSGIVLHLSQYRLLVDDACSGLYSMIFLVALGALFAHLVGVRSRVHRALLLAGTLPVALLANLLRVLLILLATYHAGDRVGQGPIHDAAGVAMFLAALAALFALDTLLARLLPEGAPAAIPARDRSAVPPARVLASPVVPSLRQALVALPLLATAGFTAVLERNTPDSAAQAAVYADALEVLVPMRFGNWHVDSTAAVVPVSSNAALKAAAAYTQTLERVYVDGNGRRIMLSIVHGRRQAEERWQIHRPEYCYMAQGFAVRESADEELATAGGTLPLRRLQTERPGRSEAVSYWLTVGEEAALPGLSRKLAQLRQRLTKAEPEGMLVRVSSLDIASPVARALHDRFIADLFAGLPDSAARRLFGSNPPGERHGNLF